MPGRSKLGALRISAGSYQNLKNWIFLQFGQALGVMTLGGKLFNADAIFDGMGSCCFLCSHGNLFLDGQVPAVEKWEISSTPSAVSAQLCVPAGFPVVGTYAEVWGDAQRSSCLRGMTVVACRDAGFPKRYQ